METIRLNFEQIKNVIKHMAQEVFRALQSLDAYKPGAENERFLFLIYHIVIEAKLTVEEWRQLPDHRIRWKHIHLVEKETPLTYRLPFHTKQYVKNEWERCFVCQKPPYILIPMAQAEERMVFLLDICKHVNACLGTKSRATKHNRPPGIDTVSHARSPSIPKNCSLRIVK